MKRRIFPPPVSACKVVGLLLALMTVALSGCSTSTSMYPQAAAYDKNVHGFDKGNRAMLMCINLPPLQIRKNVELNVQSQVTKDPFEKVSGWYQEKLSGWTNVPASGQPKPEQCPTGVSYVSPENCGSGECSKQLYVLNEGPNETWIVNVSLK